MNSENYLKFALGFYAMKKVNEGDPNKLVGGHPLFIKKKQGKTFYSNNIRAIKECKVFEIDDNQKKLLSLTDAPKLNNGINLPFPFTFIDVGFSKKDFEDMGMNQDFDEVTGIMLSKGNLVYDHKQGFGADLNDEITPDQEIVGNGLRITVMFTKGDYIWFNTFTRELDILDSYKDLVKQEDKEDKDVKDFAHNFALAFLNFLNTPDIELVQHKRTIEGNNRRVKNNKLPLPDSTSIRLIGKLKLYIDEIERLGHFDRKYTHSWWVRGHMRRLTSDWYKEKKIIHILPYIKGFGDLVEKIYQVKQKE